MRVEIIIVCLSLVLMNFLPTMEISPHNSDGPTVPIELHIADSPWPMFRQNLNHTGLSQFDTSGNSGKLRWNFTTGFYVHSSPAIGSDGTVYVGSSDNKLYAINPDGTEKWNFTTILHVHSSPAIGSDGTVYVGSDDHRLYAIGMPQNQPPVADVFLRVAGEKWHDVRMELYEDGVLTAEGSLVRYPGSPNDQMLNLTYLNVDISKKYHAIVRYTPEDDPINGQPNGATPCWIILNFSDGEELWIHHTFNVQHSETHVWEVDLTAAILMHGLTFEATAFDPGADDLTFYRDFGDRTNVTTSIRIQMKRILWR